MSLKINKISNFDDTVLKRRFRISTGLLALTIILLLISIAVTILMIGASYWGGGDEFFIGGIAMAVFTVGMLISLIIVKIYRDKLQKEKQRRKKIE